MDDVRWCACSRVAMQGLACIRHVSCVGSMQPYSHAAMPGHAFSHARLCTHATCLMYWVHAAIQPYSHAAMPGYACIQLVMCFVPMWAFCHARPCMHATCLMYWVHAAIQLCSHARPCMHSTCFACCALAAVYQCKAVHAFNLYHVLAPCSHARLSVIAACLLCQTSHVYGHDIGCSDHLEGRVDSGLQMQMVPTDQVHMHIHVMPHVPSFKP
eukprot:67631-Chlamydomonas_euryale.AAC.4